MKRSMYAKLSAVKFLSKSYTYKFLFIAFLGIHIPLIGLICFIILLPAAISPFTVFIITLALTLVATAITLYILNSLLAPLKLSKNALEQYLFTKTIPDLPTIYKDEAGILMQKVQETLTKLDGLLEEKKDFISLMSHDLRTPMAHIKLLSGLITREGISRNELQKISTMIKESITEQLSLFNTILENLRNDDLEWMKLELNETSTNEIISASLKDVEHIAKSKNIKLRINDEYKGRLNVESTIFPQVIKNLLSNSIKFSQPGSVVNLHIYKPNGITKIEIVDTGIGFNPEDSERLFEKFTSQGRNGTNNEPSTGIGLYLSRKIVEAHKGKLYAKSEGCNKSARFIIEL
ncbi:MAG: HAMP domain-containing sensor histidine kinase [Ferruginibacter sp.]